VCLALKLEHMELEREIARRRDSEPARNRARDMHRRIVEDDDGLPHFTWASQNIAIAVPLLRGLLEPATPEER
jgi:hypothetical protein